MKKLFFIISLLVAGVANAASVTFTVNHPGTRTDGDVISLDDMSIVVECGKSDDGNFADWTFTVDNLTKVNNTEQLIESPEAVDYWCRAIAVDNVNNLRSEPSPVYKADFIDPPTTLEFTIRFSPAPAGAVGG